MLDFTTMQYAAIGLICAAIAVVYVIMVRKELQ